MVNLPTTVCEYIAIPSLEPMCTADSIQSLLSRFETKMIGVVEAELAACFRQLMGSEAFKRCLRGNRHKYWQWYRPMRQSQYRGSSSCSLIFLSNAMRKPYQPTEPLTEHRATISRDRAGLFEFAILSIPSNAYLTKLAMSLFEEISKLGRSVSVNQEIEWF